MRDELKYIFTNVNDWLKFAETKHTALITFNAAAIFGALQLLGDFKTEYKCVAIFVVILFSISILISLYSFFPVFNSKFDSIDESEFQLKKNNLNVLFFEDLHKLSYLQVIELVNFKLDTNETATGIDNDLSKQIMNNARIAKIKFSLFKTGGWFTWAAVFIFLLLFFALK